MHKRSQEEVLSAEITKKKRSADEKYAPKTTGAELTAGRIITKMEWDIVDSFMDSNRTPAALLQMLCDIDLLAIHEADLFEANTWALKRLILKTLFTLSHDAIDFQHRMQKLDRFILYEKIANTAEKQETVVHPNWKECSNHFNGWQKYKLKLTLYQFSQNERYGVLNHSHPHIVEITQVVPLQQNLLIYYNILRKKKCSCFAHRNTPTDSIASPNQRVLLVPQEKFKSKNNDAMFYPEMSNNFGVFTFVLNNNNNIMIFADDCQKLKRVEALRTAAMCLKRVSVHQRTVAEKDGSVKNVYLTLPYPIITKICRYVALQNKGVQIASPSNRFDNIEDAKNHLKLWVRPDYQINRHQRKNVINIDDD